MEIINEHPVFIVNQHTSEESVINELLSNKNQEDAFFVCNISNIIQKYQRWKEVMPRVQPYYAVKCNDHPVVLKVLAELGLGFDCASAVEIEKVLSLNVDPSRIIYAHTTKPLSHIKYAASVNITLTTFDNEMELYKLKNLFSDVRAIIRIRYDAEAMCILGSKFGCDPEIEAPLLLQKAQELGINIVGVSFHVGSGCQDAIAFHGAIAAAKSIFDYASTIGYNLHILDIGGGYPGEKDSNVLEYATVINKALEKYFPSEDIIVISEPGAYFVQSAFTLLCNIHSVKKIEKNIVTTYMYYINDGVYGNFKDFLNFNVVKIPQLYRKSSSSKRYPSIIWGPTTSNKDCVLHDILLPKMEVGDWLAFNDMGAYTLTLAKSVNGFDEPYVFVIMSKDSWDVIKRKSHFNEDGC